MNLHSACANEYDKFIDQEVYDANKNKIAHIEDIVVDKTTGKTRFLKLYFTGLMDMANRYFIFPRNLFVYSSDLNGFELKY